MKLKKFLSTLSVMMFTFSLSMNNVTDIHANVTSTYNFSYTGAVQTFTAPYSGKYKLEVWGASGESSYGVRGGYGGYAKGTVYLTAGQTISIYAGGQANGMTGGWNGGGNGNYNSNGSIGTGGGGASDIRVGGTALSNRILVAGGGGGLDNGLELGDIGGDGGGLVGGDGRVSIKNTFQRPGKGGTQIAGGAGTPAGSLGQGGNAAEASDNGGGGGGYYGGGASAGGSSSAGGGSSYIGGVISGSTISGVNSGNGYVKITCMMTYANGITINKRADDLVVGQTDKLTASVIPDNASVKTVKWTSSDPSVVTVDDNGNIVAVKAGTAIITATVQDGRNLHGQCRVCVTD